MLGLIKVKTPLRYARTNKCTNSLEIQMYTRANKSTKPLEIC